MTAPTDEEKVLAIESALENYKWWQPFRYWLIQLLVIIAKKLLE